MTTILELGDSKQSRKLVQPISENCTEAVNTRIEQLEKLLLNLPQVEMPLVHRFSPGVYYREIRMPKGTFVIGHQHKTKHLNIILQGKARVMINGKSQVLEAPLTFESGENVRKVLFIEEDMIWATIHPTEETDLDKLETLLINKSQSFQLFADFEKLKQEIGALP